MVDPDPSSARGSADDPNPSQREKTPPREAQPRLEYVSDRSWENIDEDCSLLTDIARFVHLAQTGSMPTVQHNIGIGEGGLKKSIERLTRRINRGPLLKESGSRLTTTNEGAKLCQLGVVILKAIDGYRATDLQPEVPEVQICTIKSVWDVLSDGLLASHNEKFGNRALIAAPRIVEDPLNAYLAVDRKEADIGLVSFPRFPEEHRGLVVKVLWNEPMVFIAHPKNSVTEKFRSPLRSSDLSFCERILTLESGLPTGDAIMNYLASQFNGFGKRPKIHPISKNLEDIVDSVRKDLGVGIVTKSLVSGKPTAGELRLRVFELSPALIRPVGIVYRKKSLRDPVVKFTIDWLLNPANLPQ